MLVVPVLRVILDSGYWWFIVVVGISLVRRCAFSSA